VCVCPVRGDIANRTADCWLLERVDEDATMAAADDESRSVCAAYTTSWLR
jgi:hypothetical protein